MRAREAAGRGARAPLARAVLLAASAAPALALQAAEPEQLDAHASTGPLAVTRRALGVDFQLCLTDVDHDAQLDLVEAVYADLERVEELVWNWSRTSAVSRLNAARGKARVALDPELADALREARDFCRACGGTFDPTVGTLLAAMGVYTGAPRALAEAEVEGLRPGVGCGAFELGRDEGGAWIERRTADVVLDLSGLAKGWAVDRAVALLRARGVGNAFVAAGSSSVYGMGPGPTGEGWDFELPGPGGAPLVWWLRDEAVSSSGRLSQPLDLGAGRVSHVIDPRTGRPVAHAVEATYFRGPDACEADMASTALLVMGPDEARAWFAGRPEWARARRALLVEAPRRETGAAGAVRRAFVELGGPAADVEPAER